MKPLTKAQKEKVASEELCRTCGSRPSTDGHHVINRSVSRRPDSTDAIIPVCRLCHSEIHAGNVDVLPFLTIAEQADSVYAAGSLATAWRRLS